MNKEIKQKERWGSRVGFILAASGSAVGLGNLQRFPYLASECGGSAFVFIYILCVLGLGIPLMLVELSMGRHTQKNPVDGIDQLSSNRLWKYAGGFGIFICYAVLTYYLVASGWTLGYVFQMLSSSPLPFDEFAAMPQYVVPCSIVILLCAALVVRKGLKRGVELWSKILMPALIILLLFLVVHSLLLPNSWAGVKYYLYPDFSEINAKVFLYALSQALFSLSMGEAILFTYGSYCSKRENIVKSAYFIAIFDTGIALLSGLVLFPAIFSFGVSPKQGVGLVFHIMPNIFLKMPFGNIFGALFFLMLSFAALTTCIAHLEVTVSYFIRAKGWSRNKATWVLSLIALAISIPAALSKGGNGFLSTISIERFNEVGLYEIMDFLFGGLAMIVGSFLFAIFVGWVWGVSNATKELRISCDHFTWQGKLWGVLIKYVAPLAILLVFLSQIF